MKHMFGCGMMKTKKNFSMTKADIGLAGGIAVAALLLLLFMYLGRTQGEYAQVSCDGRPVCRIPLMQEQTRYYLVAQGSLIKEFSEQEWKDAACQEMIRTEYEAYNVILCQEGRVCVTEADCPDKICVHHKPVSAAGENIICLPHKVVIEMIGSQESELDGVVY